jgi:hypothetical protein
LACGLHAVLAGSHARVRDAVGEVAHFLAAGGEADWEVAAAWTSNVYGKRTRSQRLSYRTRITGETLVATLIYSADRSSCLSLDLSMKGGVRELVIEGDDSVRDSYRLQCDRASLTDKMGRRFEWAWPAVTIPSRGDSD